MSRHALIVGLLTVTSLGVASVDRAVAEPRAFKLIVHPDNPAQSVNADVVRNAFLGKGTAWPRGVVIRPIGLSSKFTEREKFDKRVLKKTPAQLKSYWTQQIFSGKGVPPPEARSTADVIAYVLSNPAAVGYLPADADAGAAKVVSLQ